jgi:hypothetical protein
MHTRQQKQQGLTRLHGRRHPGIKVFLPLLQSPRAPCGRVGDACACRLIIQESRHVGILLPLRALPHEQGEDAALDVRPPPVAIAKRYMQDDEMRWGKVRQVDP